MPTARFPYDLPGRDALVKLLQENKPKWGVESHTVDFDPPYSSPTYNTPGRTFIDVFLLDRGIRTVFRYKRLDIDLALPNDIELSLAGPITPRKIVEEINRAYGMMFDENDLNMTDDVIVEEGISFQYRLRARASSYVWYGTRIIRVIPPVSVAAILEETGEPMLTESGETITMESE